jgi:hypothetical protein
MHHLDDQRIRVAAYERWEREGRPHGKHVDHWLAAESELLRQVYRGRLSMRPLTLKEIELKALIEAGLTPVLVGDPGVGKTSMVHAVARHLDRPVHVVTPSILEPPDLKGWPIPNREAGYAEYLPLKWVVTLPANAILFLDELSSASPAMQAALLRVVLDRMVGDWQLGPGIAIVCAANPPEQIAAAQLSLPLQNRFVYITVKPFAEEFVEHFPTLWASKPLCAWRQMVAIFIQSNPSFIHCMPKEGAAAATWAWPSPRTWEFAARILATTGGQGNIAAAVGEDAARAFVAWRQARRVPSPDNLLSGADWPRLPAEVLTAALALSTFVEERHRLGTLEEAVFGRALEALARAPARDLVIGPAAAVLRCRQPAWQIPDGILAIERIVRDAEDEG